MQNAPYQTYLIFGPPGSGKGTLGKTLGSIPRFHHFACGDVFRALDTRTPVGQAFLEYSSRGELVPDEVTIRLWKATIGDAVRAHQFKPDIDSLVLDGIPRNVEQARLMADLINVRRVFYLCVQSHGELVARIKKRALKQNRLDDANERVIEQRLKTYEEESRPLLEYYGVGMITAVDALQPPIRVLAEVVNAIIGTNGA